MVSSAVKITGFEDLDTYIRRGQFIVIAECLYVHKNNGTVIDGLSSVDVHVIRTLQGPLEPGPLIVRTIRPMTPGKTYLLYTLGGDKFYTTAELSVVEVPPGHVWHDDPFLSVDLDHKPLRVQLLLLFAERLAQVKKELAEKTSLTLSWRDKERQSLWTKLKNPSPSDGVSKFLETQLPAESRNLLAEYAFPFRKGDDDRRLSQVFLRELNRLIQTGPIYDPERFAGIKFSPETSTLLWQKPRGKDLVRLNIALLLDAYPQGLSRDWLLDEEKRLLEKAAKEPAPAPWLHGQGRHDAHLRY
jgi:hypothetical protein